MLTNVNITPDFQTHDNPYDGSVAIPVKILNERDKNKCFLSGISYI